MRASQDARFLRYFMCAAQHGSIRKASDELHIAAFTIDPQILQGECTLDTLLFKRLPAGLRLTVADDLLLPACNRWSRDMNTIRTQIAVSRV
ncbi:helix-turn-helix domain-containing protein [Acetobacter sp.]|jgi:DNA-binding transcriptional LysR family regulator|uniref:helix-turn-helix domain-containing protein n=1 Tax=Acetobacter sp. TaxID=440 RepID=UPI0025BA1872|nr:LysR family transcriptional regulator [Acetobacter sp.]MCH4091397.1 LysR family transcriptional regulator [Acetobacter sp.]MCI1299375.1 LysR family transcriptional regulator [Acetobacter sp.]MCI1316621.1 LysR family transcriptional regulator [Acetobacter sp.]